MTQVQIAVCNECAIQSLGHTAEHSGRQKCLVESHGSDAIHFKVVRYSWIPETATSHHLQKQAKKQTNKNISDYQQNLYSDQCQMIMLGFGKCISF